MATCPKCPNGTFKQEEITISGAQYRQNGIMCASCGCLITVQPIVDATKLIRRLAEQLKVRLE
jgi:hypothetical protein